MEHVACMMYGMLCGVCDEVCAFICMWHGCILPMLSVGGVYVCGVECLLYV